jgi:hypothetical protein
VILAQSAATSRAYAAKYSDRFDENVDMVGLGMANLGAGLSGTFIVNGSPTNTAMVDGGGGRSQIAQLTTCVLVLLVLLFLTGPLALSADRRSLRHRLPGGGENDRCQGHAPDLRLRRVPSSGWPADCGHGRRRWRRAGDPSCHGAVAARPCAAGLPGQQFW